MLQTDLLLAMKGQDLLMAMQEPVPLLPLLFQRSGQQKMLEVDLLLVVQTARCYLHQKFPKASQVH